VVSEDIKNSYIENDGNVSADVVNIQSEFDTKGGSITAGDVDEARAENDGGNTETPPTGDGSGSEEPPPML